MITESRLSSKMLSHSSPAGPSFETLSLGRDDDQGAKCDVRKFPSDINLDSSPYNSQNKLVYAIMSKLRGPFYLPIPTIENERVTLIPFDFATHAEPFVQGTKDHPELFQYVGYGPFLSIEQFSTLYDGIESRDNEALFAIIARQNPQDKGAFAGIIGFDGGSPKDATIEIGLIHILPAFQRTFVTSNAVGLLLQCAMDAPPTGFGLRRCEWKAHAGNEASKRVALRMGFEFEGIMRFHRIVPAGKPNNGHEVPAHSSLGHSRDSFLFAHYCDGWQEKRKQVVAVMDRK